MSLHPATKILSWCVLVAALQFLTPSRLLIVTACVLLSSFALSRRKLLQLLHRTRWIMLVLWFIYAYSTPGQPFSVSLGYFSPSVEGLQDGGLQLMRLLAALASLAILLDRLHRQKLIAGLYWLFLPMKLLGISRERLAVRLALTLHYAEVAMLKTQSWQDSLRTLKTEKSELKTEDRAIELPVFRFAGADALLLAGLVLLLWVVCI